jgi:histidine ammonia-lyase
MKLDGPGVTIADVVAVARGGEVVELTPAAVARMDASRAVVEGARTGRPRYGISTGFGGLATVVIPEDQRAALQVALIRSHAAGMGPAVEPEVVRAMTFLRARTLAMGVSGARAEVAQGLLDLLNARITPLVPEHGSLGASGDLAPLAHVALALLGEGQVVADSRPGGAEPGGEGGGRRTLPAAEALHGAGLAPLVLSEKEGLALTNGTDGMLGMLCLAAHDALHLLRTADVVAALTVEGLLATDRAYTPDLQALRPHPGQARSAANLVALLAGSPIVASHREDDPRVQDAYSIRCTPQVHGAARDTLDFVTAVAERELAAAIDNPMVLPDGRIESCGNFHGAPLGYAADFLAIALADAGAIAERRIDRMLDPGRSHGLPPFLAANPGVDSGLMIAHYTAAAVSTENRRLAAPASVDSLPTSALQEDHVSMGWSAARKLRRVVANLARILAVELVAGARAVELRAPLEPAVATGSVIRVVRGRIPGLGPDRFLAPELATAEEMVWSDVLLDAVRSAGVELS